MNILLAQTNRGVEQVNVIKCLFVQAVGVLRHCWSRGTGVRHLMEMREC